LEEFSERG
jgi:hypothetical protein